MSLLPTVLSSSSWRIPRCCQTRWDTVKSQQRVQGLPPGSSPSWTCRSQRMPLLETSTDSRSSSSSPNSFRMPEGPNLIFDGELSHLYLQCLSSASNQSSWQWTRDRVKINWSIKSFAFRLRSIFTTPSPAPSYPHSWTRPQRYFTPSLQWKMWKVL